MRFGPPKIPTDRSCPILAIGDVHGMTDMLLETLIGADSIGAFPVLLGDLVDKGPDSVGVLRLVLDRLAQGSLAFVRGNHEERLLQWLTNPERDGKPSPAHTETMEERDARDLAASVRDVLATSPCWVTLPGYILVHGAFHPDMLTRHPNGASGAMPQKLRALALYAEVDGTRGDDGLPVRAYNWIESIPSGLTVIVGHDTRQMHAPLIADNNAGGRAVFLDTGAAKGGRLSSWLIPAL